MLTERKLKMVTYISTYGFRCLEKGRGICLEVGAYGRDNFLYSLHDDTGNNISRDNEYYGDLTALYWIWKNGEIKKDKIISFRHYNKYLIISKEKARRYLKKHKNGWIVAKKIPIPPHNYQDEWSCFREIIKASYPVYYDKLLELYDCNDGAGSQCNATNMFITSVDQLNDYCSVLFDIIKELREKVGDTDHSRSDQRYCAFMAERFLSVYLYTHDLPVLEVDVCRTKRVLYCIKQIAKRTGIKRNARIIMKIEKILYRDRYKSSYDDYK